MADTLIHLTLNDLESSPLTDAGGGRMVLRPVAPDWQPVEFHIPPGQASLVATVPSTWVPIPEMTADVFVLGYRTTESDPFAPTIEATTPISIVLSREPERWTPTFTLRASLPKRTFQALLDILAVSTEVDTKTDHTLHKLEDWFDQMTSPDLMLAKMALLNLYAVLSTEINPISSKPWFDTIQKFVRVDQERLVAEVTKDCYDAVQRILRTLDHFAPIGYFTELDPGAHAPNFPSRYGVKAQDIISVKRGYEAGNFQLTLAQSRSMPGTYLLDCDMDEDREIAAHTLDCLAHLVDGGTHPIDMHEYIVHDSAQVNDGRAPVDLGYTLSRAR
ncbi:MAG: hypothetical protein ACRD1V_18715 [Vicinamibacterales bacterium]